MSASNLSSKSAPDVVTLADSASGESTDDGSAKERSDRAFNLLMGASQPHIRGGPLNADKVKKMIRENLEKDPPVGYKPRDFDKWQQTDKTASLNTWRLLDGIIAVFDKDPDSELSVEKSPASLWRCGFCCNNMQQEDYKNAAPVRIYAHFFSRHIASNKRHKAKTDDSNVGYVGQVWRGLNEGKWCRLTTDGHLHSKKAWDRYVKEMVLENGKKLDLRTMESETSGVLKITADTGDGVQKNDSLLYKALIEYCALTDTAPNAIDGRGLGTLHAICEAYVKTEPRLRPKGFCRKRIGASSETDADGNTKLVYSKDVQEAVERADNSLEWLVDRVARSRVDATLCVDRITKNQKKHK